MNYLVPLLFFTDPEVVSEPVYLSDVLTVLGWVISFFILLPVWAAFISPHYGPHRTINVLFLREWFPQVAGSVDYFVEQIFRVKNLKTRSKLGVSLWRVLIYSLFISFAVYMLCTEGWFSIPNFRFCVWGDLALTPPPKAAWPPHVSPFCRQYYLLRMGYALFSVTNLVLNDNKRPDYLMYVIHHFCEFSLLLFSFTCRFTRFGVVVLLIHDPSDLFLQMAKATAYATRDPKNQRYKDVNAVFFALFMICWLVLRLIGLPLLFSSIWTDVVNPMKTLARDICRVDVETVTIVIRLLFTGLAAGLYVLHLIWFWMIVRIALVIVTKNNYTDTRSDDDNDPEVKRIEAELELKEKLKNEKLNKKDE